jgi:hypothetical protein
MSVTSCRRADKSRPLQDVPTSSDYSILRREFIKDRKSLVLNIAEW